MLRCVVPVPRAKPEEYAKAATPSVGHSGTAALVVVALLLATGAVPSATAGARPLLPDAGGRYLRAPNLCGPNSLGVVCAIYGKRISQERLCELTRADVLRPSSMLDIVQAARVVGLDCDGIEADLADLCRIREPVIIHFRPPEGRDIGHFAVLYGYADGKFLVLDPTRTAPTVRPEDELAKLYSGHAVRFNDPVPVLSPHARLREAPSLRLEGGPTMELGRVASGSLVGFSLTLRNRGTAALVVEDVRSGCACVATNGKGLRIAAGKAKELAFEWSVAATEGPTKQIVALHTNDGEHPITLISITAQAVKHFVIDPPRLLLDPGDSGPPEKVLAVHSLRGHDCAVRVRSDTAAWIRTVPGGWQSGPSVRLAVTCAETPEEEHAARLRLEVDCRTCDVRADVAVPVALAPAR